MKVIYTAKSFSGETKGGEMEVKNERDLASQLRSDGFLLTSFKEIGEEKNDIKANFMDRFMGIPLKEKVIFARNMSVMISSGLSLPRAVKDILLQTSNKRFKGILDNVLKDLQTGVSFADSLAKYPAVFNELFVNMVRVGETSGNLEEVLNLLAAHLEKEHKLISRIKGAMIYPAVILLVMIAVGVIMLTYVLPTLIGVFKDMKVVLPLPTRIIIWTSDALKSHAILVGVLLVGSIIFSFIFSKTKTGKIFISFFTIRIPFIKNIVMKVNCARFARTYSSLLKSGVSVVEALRIISRTLSNYYYKQSMLDAMGQIKKGVSLSKVIAMYPKIFPILVSQMAEVGEETGKTEAVLLKLAEFYEDEVEQITKNLSSVIEPALMVVMGIAVGFFAVAMLQPMYSMMENIK